MKEQGPILIIKHAETRDDADAAILSGLHPAPVETIETPTRTYRLTDSEGKPPPMVPTAEAVKVWGRQWWMMHDPGNGDKDAVVADVWGGAQPWYTFGVGSAPVKDDGSWLGPVTERPKEEA